MDKLEETQEVDKFLDSCNKLSLSSSDKLSTWKNNGHQQLNPLLNPVVLDTFFRVCPPEVLKNCRLVCKLWYDLLLDRIRDKFVYHVIISIGNDGEEDTDDLEFTTNDLPSLSRWTSVSDDDEDEYETELNLTQLKEIFQTPGHLIKIAEKPIQNWKVELTLNHVPNNNYDNEDILYFINTFGSWTKFLNLYNVQVGTKEDVQLFKRVLYSPHLCNVENLVLSQFLYEPENIEDYEVMVRLSHVEKELESFQQRNLKSLQITLTGMSVLGDGLFPIPWVEVLSHFPCIESLKLEGFRDPQSINDVLEGIKTVKQADKTNLQLTTLDLIEFRSFHAKEFPQPGSRLLQELKLPLTTLAFDVGYTTDKATFRDVIAAHAATLKVLKLGRCQETPPYLEFPFGIKFDKLEEFSCEGAICTSFSFLRFMPNLKSLKFSERLPLPFSPNKKLYLHLLRETTSSDFENVKLTTLEEFMILEAETPTLEQVQAFITCMPNVRKLRMALTNETFRLVCQNWKQLTEFSTYDSCIDDEGLTGLEFGIDGQPLPEAFQTRLPNITDLKNLQRLVMYGRRAYGTDNSVFHGFLQLPNLKELEIGCSSHMSKEAHVALKEKIDKTCLD